MLRHTFGLSKECRFSSDEVIGHDAFRKNGAFCPEMTTFIGSETVDSKIWYPRRIMRDEKARKEYRSSDKGYVRGDIYVIHILEEEMTIDDERLQSYVSVGRAK